METKKYIFSLDYGNRMEEKEFIKAVLREFDSNTLVGCGIFVNNNPYCLELLFFASLEKDTDRFEDFMKKHFNDKQRVFNYFFDDIIESFYKRGYNVKTFIEADEVDFIITDEPNGLFLFPSKEIVNKIGEPSSTNVPSTSVTISLIIFLFLQKFFYLIQVKIKKLLM